MDCHFKVERLSDFSVLDSFECGVAQMDNFIHGNLKYCDANHYCSSSFLWKVQICQIVSSATDGCMAYV